MGFAQVLILDTLAESRPSRSLIFKINLWTVCSYWVLATDTILSEIAFFDRL